MLDTEWLKGVTTNDTHHLVVRELAEEVERLRAALDGHHAAWSTKWENCSICRALAVTEDANG